MVGYRYYETADVDVRYPFGHGLSYTTFETNALSVTVTGDDTATVSVTVTNTGPVTGKHVIQVYVATSAGPVRRPTRELRAFTKIELAPGETRTVDLALERRAFAYYDVELARWVVAPGDYTIQIGNSAANIVVEKPITLTGDTIKRVLSLDSPVQDWFGHPVVGPAITSKIAESMSLDQAKQAGEAHDWMRMVASLPMKQFTHFLTSGGAHLPDDALAELIELSKN